MEEYELSYYSWPHFEPFIRNDLFSKEKKNPNYSMEKTQLGNRNLERQTTRVLSNNYT